MRWRRVKWLQILWKHIPQTMCQIMRGKPDPRCPHSLSLHRRQGQLCIVKTSIWRPTVLLFSQLNTLSLLGARYQVRGTVIAFCTPGWTTCESEDLFDFCRRSPRRRTIGRNAVDHGVPSEPFIARGELFYPEFVLLQPLFSEDVLQIRAPNLYDDVLEIVGEKKVRYRGIFVVFRLRVDFA